jgi:lysophospholipase L1-like esterase
MSCVNYAVMGSTVGKKPGSYESAYDSISDWNDAVSGGLVDTSKTYLVKDNGSADFPWAIYSYSGGTWSAGARTPAGAQRTPIADRITEMATDADVIFVQGGTNDFQYDWDELGEDGDTAITTVKGATRAICEFLINTYPKKLIVWITSLTPFRYQGTNTTPYSKNSLGYSGWDSHDAEMEVCEEYGIPVIDIGAEICLSPANPWWDDYDSAGTRVHPNDEGHRIAAAYLVEKLLTMKKSL